MGNDMSEWVEQKVQDSENDYLNTTYWDIHPLFMLVKDGKTEELKKGLHIRFENFAKGRITKDERKQLEYLAVSLINTFMIAAIQGGVYPTEANAAADRALQKLSRIHSVSEITAIVNEAAIELCELARNEKQKNTGNPHVENARHFLSANLTQEIRMEDAAEAAGISLYHLCRLFRQYTGMTMREYLVRERIETARRLLVTTERPIPRIAALLRFCDQSYFTRVFRTYTGMTPGEYRRKNKI
ncbi:MAG: AraC family transcriptional regulator [Erysipelotrichaceae bacterium]|nr:AraC family transcriptional regulator [Erysipelotrichaceae bacterium]